MATVNLGRIKPQWQGTYASETSYVVDDMVLYNNSAYICTAASQGNAPTNTSYWDLMTQGFSGDASDLSTGTIPDARFPSTLPAIDGSALTNVSAGKVLQVVQNFDDNYVQTGSGAGSTWYDVISASITPSSTSSKILITGHITIGTNGAYGSAARIILNGSSDIGTASASGLSGRLLGHSVGTHGSNTHDCTTYPINYLHTPSTTSSTSYKLQVGARDQNAWAKNGPWDNNDSNTWYRAQGTTCLQLWEIAG